MKSKNFPHSDEFRYWNFDIVFSVRAKQTDDTGTGLRFSPKSPFP